VRKIFLPIIILVYLLGCVRDQFYDNESETNRRNHSGNNPTSNNVIGSWVVACYENLENGSVISKNDVPSMGGMDVELKFMNDGTFCGFNTTNEIAGHYTLRDFTIKIDVYGGTKVGQPEWGDMFSDIVYSVESFRRTNSELKLYYNNNKNCVVLNPKRRGIECAWTYSDI
jgi:heat shock protein HslJ